MSVISLVIYKQAKQYKDNSGLPQKSNIIPVIRPFSKRGLNSSLVYTFSDFGPYFGKR